jgi:hypothetical protein
MICGPEVCASRMWVCHVARRNWRKMVERVVEMRERWVCSVGRRDIVGGVVDAVMGGEVGRKREGGEVWRILVCVVLLFCCEVAFTMATDNEDKHRPFITDLQSATWQYCHRTLLE